MRETHQGTFHFHSTYSHDGRTTLTETARTLAANGYAFCIMTEHFEDFDAPKFQRYVQEVESINQAGQFVFVPGIEVNLSGIDTILFPVRDYDAVARYAATGIDPEGAMFKVVAHPSKYTAASVLDHLKRYDIDAVELWNQQADGRYIPPRSVLGALRAYDGRAGYRYLFGCDLHDVRLTVANVIAVSSSAPLTPRVIVEKLTAGDFVTSSLTTGIALRGDLAEDALDAWFDAVVRRPYHRGTALRYVRRLFRWGYRRFPRGAQRSLNNFKNFVRNKV